MKRVHCVSYCIKKTLREEQKVVQVNRLAQNAEEQNEVRVAHIQTVQSVGDFMTSYFNRRKTCFGITVKEHSDLFSVVPDYLTVYCIEEHRMITEPTALRGSD